MIMEHAVNKNYIRIYNFEKIPKGLWKETFFYNLCVFLNTKFHSYVFAEDSFWFSLTKSLILFNFLEIWPSPSLLLIIIIFIGIIKVSIKVQEILHKSVKMKTFLKYCRRIISFLLSSHIWRQAKIFYIIPKVGQKNSAAATS